MNQHPKRSGQTTGNKIEMQQCATRLPLVMAIVLCVIFAAAVVGISSCRKPPSHQETQTQPKVAVQSEMPTPETEIAESETETPEPEAVSPVSVPQRSVLLDSLTAAPVSQANPAAGQLTGNQVNSPTPAEDEQSYDFSHELKDEKVTFDAINPMTKVPGQMTVTITGAFRGNRLSDGQTADGEAPVGSHLKADQRATFSFVPYDRYSPTYSATVGGLGVAGNSTNDSVFFDFGLTATAPDGSSQQFMLREVVTVTEDGAHVTFEQLKQPDANK
jgi:cytoskeletal protein RodZ